MIGVKSDVRTAVAASRLPIRKFPRLHALNFEHYSGIIHGLLATQIRLSKVTGNAVAASARMNECDILSQIRRWRSGGRVVAGSDTSHMA